MGAGEAKEQFSKIQNTVKLSLERGCVGTEEGQRRQAWGGKSACRFLLITEGIPERDPGTVQLWSFKTGLCRNSSLRSQTFISRRDFPDSFSTYLSTSREGVLYVKQITNKDLLHSTGNSAQYSVITHMGK